MKIIISSNILKLPTEIVNWINNSYNIKKILKAFQALKLLNNNYSIKIGNIIYYNDYIDKYSNINITIVNNFNGPTVSYNNSHGSFNIDDKTVYINASSFPYPDEAEIKSLLIHELTHAIDPKLNKDDNLYNKSLKHNNRYNSWISPSEIDAYISEIVYIIKKYGYENKILEWLKTNKPFPETIPYNFKKYFKKMNDEQLKRVKKILYRQLTQDNYELA